MSATTAHSPQAKLLKDPDTAISAAGVLAVLAAHPPTAKAIIATDGMLQLLVDKLHPGKTPSGGC